MMISALLVSLLALSQNLVVSADTASGMRRLLKDDSSDWIGDPENTGKRGWCEACTYVKGELKCNPTVNDNKETEDEPKNMLANKANFIKCIPKDQCTTKMCTPMFRYIWNKGVKKWDTQAWCECVDAPPPCFPASATVRRVNADNELETVSMPKLRIGDSVECLVRDPVFQPNGEVISSSISSRVTRCQVYDYKKARTNGTSPYLAISYKVPGSNKVGTVTMTANHHILDANTGKAVQAGDLKAGDELQMITDDVSSRVKVTKVTPISANGAYVPLLTNGGLLIVDGIVAYPSSGECGVGLDAKHWGQYFLAAPVWQNLNEDSPNFGKTLLELGAKAEVGAFTQKFYAVAGAATQEGRHFADWAGVAAEMHRAITQFQKVYTEKEALAVYNRYLYKPTM